MADTGFKSPTTSAEIFTQWSLEDRAYSSDDSRATTGPDDASSTIIELSWDGGSTWTSTSNSLGSWTGSDTTKTAGGAADTWGRSWSDSELSADNFKLFLNSNTSKKSEWGDFTFNIPASATINGIEVALEGRTQSAGPGNTLAIDHIQVKVYYTEEAGAINPKVKISGTFATKKTLVKIGGTFAEKPVMVKVSGTFQ